MENEWIAVLTISLVFSVMIILTIVVKKQRERILNISEQREEFKSWIEAIKQILWK